nr:MAG TPA: hypothetical protein [Caudoviricetes sp.]
MADVSFSLDTNAANAILTEMASGLVNQSAVAVAQRAQSMISSVSTEPLKVNVSTGVGTIRRGTRAIGKVSINTANKHQAYIANTVLRKAKDAGRVD